MISSDCKDCEYYDGCNKRYLCKLDNPLRCTILHRWVKEKRFRGDFSYEKNYGG